MVFLPAAFRIAGGKLNNGLRVFVDIFSLEICQRWLNANTGIVHNDISLSTPVHDVNLSCARLHDGSELGASRLSGAAHT